MQTLKTQTLLGDIAFGEGPRWRDGRLYFSDMHSQRVLAVDMEGRTEVICVVPQDPSGLGWLPDGRMLVVSMRDRRLLCLEEDGSPPLRKCSLSEERPPQHSCRGDARTRNPNPDRLDRPDGPDFSKMVRFFWLGAWVLTRRGSR